MVVKLCGSNSETEASLSGNWARANAAKFSGKTWHN